MTDFAIDMAQSAMPAAAGAITMEGKRHHIEWRGAPAHD